MAQQIRIIISQGGKKRQWAETGIETEKDGRKPMRQHPQSG
jgi:hypothetical protein